MRHSIALLIVLAFAVTACGPKTLPPIVEQGVVNQEAKRQQQLFINDYVERQAKVNRVSRAILGSNLTACEEYNFDSGALVMDPSDVFRPYRDAARYFLFPDDRARVIAVAPRTPAEKAGLQPGDAVLAVNGEAVGGSGAAVRKLRKSRVVKIRFERAGQQQEIELTQDRVCDSPVTLFEDPEINAYAFGSQIWLTVGIVKFTKTDDELALVVGHELAHNAMKHLKAKRGNSMIGALLIDAPIAAVTGVNLNIGGSIGASAYSQDFESEADYVGLYFTARAGYDISGVAELWRRMAVENPGAIYTASTHPTTANRFVALEAARDEIKAKMAAGQELEPNMKAGQ